MKEKTISRDSFHRKISKLTPMRRKPKTVTTSTEDK